MNTHCTSTGTERVVRAILIAGLALGGSAGCVDRVTIFDDYHRVQSKDQAGSTQIAVLSVAPLSAYGNSLSGNFSMDDATALARVLPNSLLFTRKELDALKLGAKLALPTSLTTSTATTKLDADGTTTTTSERTKEKAPGDVSGLTEPASAAGARTASGVTGTDIGADQLKTDPFLQHQVALALKQEIALLNQQVRDAAIRRGMVPYVVRMQVTLMPSARKQPYDAEVFTSFFNGQGTARVPAKFQKSGQPPEATFKTPFVLPLLAADNLEGALQSRSIDQLRQLSLALSATVQGIGAGFDAQKFNEQFEQAFGRDLNSLMSVSRASDNTLKVRLGAQLSPSSGYQMITRNHYVSFLLLMDKRYEPYTVGNGDVPTVQVVARTELTDALTGKRLRNRTSAEARAALDKVRSDYELQSIDSQVTENLIGLAQENDWIAFKKTAAAAKLSFPHALWSSLIGLNDGSSFDSTSFDLPQLPQARLSDQSLLLVDDGKVTKLSLFGNGLIGKPLKAALTVNGKRLPATASTVSNGQMALEFPSLNAWDLQSKATTAADCSGVTVQVTAGADFVWPSVNGNEVKGCRYLFKESKPSGAQKAAFSVSSAAAAVVSTKGSGSVKVSIDIGKDAKGKPSTAYVTLAVEGADIKTASGGALKAGNRLQVSTSGDVTLTLDRLLPGNLVKIGAVAADGKTKVEPLILTIANS